MPLLASHFTHRSASAVRACDRRSRWPCGAAGSCADNVGARYIPLFILRVEARSSPLGDVVLCVCSFEEEHIFKLEIKTLFLTLFQALQSSLQIKRNERRNQTPQISDLPPCGLRYNLLQREQLLSRPSYGIAYIAVYTLQHNGRSSGTAISHTTCVCVDTAAVCCRHPSGTAVSISKHYSLAENALCT